MLFVRIENHGYGPDDLDPRRGAKLAIIGKNVKSACEAVLDEIDGLATDPMRSRGDVVVDMPFNASLGGRESPIIVLIDVLAWPEKLAEKPGMHEIGLAKLEERRVKARQDLADGVGAWLRQYFTSGRAFHVTVRTPDPATTTTCTR